MARANSDSSKVVLDLLFVILIKCKYSPHACHEVAVTPLILKFGTGWRCG